MRRFILFLIVVALAVFGLYRWNESRRPRLRPESYTPADGPRIDLKDVEVLAALDKEFTRLVDAVIPSVASITTAKRVQQRSLVDPLELFLGRRYRSLPTERIQRSLGSGVIVSHEGHILTNNHVVAEVDEIQVQLHDGRVLPARVVGTDIATDLAVLRIDAGGVIPLPFGDSDAVAVGQRVVAVGNPFGLEETVTQGIISATGRSTPDSSMEFFQTDTAINPGNSGGPLVNLRGEIVGINTAIGGETGNWAGVGFAIPSNMARRVMEGILKTGTVVRGFLGVVPVPVSQEAAQQLGMRDHRGALIADVGPMTPAGKADLRRGDVIREFDGHRIRNAAELRRRISEAPIGKSVVVKVFREGKETALNVEIAELSPDLTSAAKQAPDRVVGLRPFDGVRVNEIPSILLSRLPRGAGGAFVTEVEGPCPASGRIVPGDIIEEVNNVAVRSPRDLAGVAARLQPGEKAIVLLLRDFRPTYTVIDP
jgi:serine protease Do